MSSTIRYNSIFIICLLFLVKLGTNTSKIRPKYVFVYVLNPYATRVYTRIREIMENKVLHIMNEDVVVLLQLNIIAKLCLIFCRKWYNYNGIIRFICSRRYR